MNPAGPPELPDPELVDRVIAALMESGGALGEARRLLRRAQWYLWASMTMALVAFAGVTLQWLRACP